MTPIPFQTALPMRMAHALLWCCLLIGAPASGNPLDAGNATRGEIARLPEYCGHVMFYTRDPQERARWFDRMGRVFEHLHHYCFAMVKANRAASPNVEPHLRRSLYSSAVNECRYVLRNWPDPAFVLRPEIFYRMGTYEAANESWVAAIEFFEQSIEAKRDYWPPHVAMADVNLRIGRRGRAIEVLNAALEAMPGEPQLLEALKRAEGRRGVAGGSR